jgi:hypothetical protein
MARPRVLSKDDTTGIRPLRNPQYEIFANARARGCSKAKAARMANVSQARARQAGYEWELRPEVAARISHLLRRAMNDTEADGHLHEIIRRGRDRDRLRALDIRNRVLGRYRELHEFSGPEGGPIMTETKVEFYVPENGRRA